MSLSMIHACLRPSLMLKRGVLTFSNTSTKVARFQPGARLVVAAPSRTTETATTRRSMSTFVMEQPSSAESLWDIAISLIKRTFQPSIIRRKRKMGFLVRQRTVGGRRVIARRKAKGRLRLGGGI